MEELFETLTWGQLGLHQKPVGILNINGYYDALKALCDTMVQDGFLQECVNHSLIFSGDIADLIDQMDQYQPYETPKLITRQTT